MRILIAIDVGLEFGWRAIKFIPKIRHLSRLYDTTYVMCQESMFPLYVDFAEHIHSIYYSAKLSPDMWRYKDTQVDYVYPTKQLCCKSGEDEFFKYGNRAENKAKPIIVIHPRKKLDGREWDVWQWDKFVSIFKQQHPGFRIISIGERSATHGIGNIEDRRGISLSYVIELLNSAKLIVGPSSGPMHLASLCGCPQIIFSDKKRWNLGDRKGTNRERYENFWNPFKTPVTVVDEYGWKPAAEIILNKTKELLCRG